MRARTCLLHFDIELKLSGVANCSRRQAEESVSTTHACTAHQSIFTDLAGLTKESKYSATGCLPLFAEMTESGIESELNQSRTVMSVSRFSAEFSHDGKR